MKAALKQQKQGSEMSNEADKDGRPAGMTEKRWKQHLAWNKVMNEGQSTPDPSWRTSSENLCKSN